MTRPAAHSSRLTRLLAPVLAAATIIAGGLVAAAPAAAADPAPVAPETVTVDLLPTWQINGVVWSQAVVGTTVYVTGSFTKARPPGVAAGGAGEIDANNVFAFDITTGNPVAGFSHSFDAQGLVVRAAPDGKTVYFGGDFTTVDGQARAHVAAFDVATGALTPWAPRTDGQVRAFSFIGDTVYAGGNFRSSNGQPRTELAAWSATTGALTSWAPTASGDGFVWDMVTSPDASRLIVAGSFTVLNGATAYGMGALDAATGASLPWAAVDRIRSAGLNGAISSLSTDGTQVYGSGYAFGAGASFEGTFAADPYTGALNWVNDCLGDTYSTFPQNGVLYVASHHHDCSVVGGFPDTNPRSRWMKATAEPTTPVGTITRKDAYGWDFTGLPYAGLLNWYPDLDFGSYTSARQAAWSVTGNSNYVVLGGEFPKVNGVAQQGLARFGKRTVSPHLSGPIYTAAMTPTPYSNERGLVRVPFSSAWDRDGAAVTYDVFRSPATKIATFSRTDGRFWSLPSLSIVDSGQTPGSQVRYQVRAKDADGNIQWSAWSPWITVSDAATSAYRAAVRAGGASHYWRLGEPSGATRLFDDVGDTPGIPTGLALGAPGALQGDTDAAITSAGGSTPRMTTVDPLPSDTAVSVEAWVNTTSTRGGRIVGFGDSATGTSSSGGTDRVLYLDTTGRVNFAINDGAYRTVYSRGSVNDGQWHHLVGTVDGTGMQLFVDGIRVGRSQAATTPKSYTGYWRIGADQTSGFTNRPTDAGLAGSIDDVAVYPKALSQTDVQSHYTVSGRTGAWGTAGSDAYGTTVSADRPDLYWRLDEATGTALTDAAGGGPVGALSGTVTRAVGGITPSSSATTFNGSTALGVAQEAWDAPQAFSAELWVKTTSTKGGKLIGFGNTSSGLSSSYDRHVVMQSNGRVNFGTYNGTQNTITSTNAYNDGQWHHIVASQGADGMKLWIDTQLVASSPVTTAQVYRGFWRIGGDKTWGNTSSNYIAGTLDEVAVYPSVLSESRVRAHFAAAGRVPSERAPVPSFTVASTYLTTTVDGSATTDADGNLATYAWNFGDGTSASGPTATHTYAAAGTYTITLTATDATLLTGALSKTVTVAPNQAPTAAFSPTIDHLALSVDGSASHDSDGSIAAFAWDFGDGTSASGTNAAHTYAAPGDYTVRLTVTDNDGMTGTMTRVVTASAVPNQPPTAAFTETTDFLSVSVDASASTDPDGSIASFAWDFGDGSTGAGATASHVYTSAGTYTVSLVTTDDKGATTTASHAITVVADQPPVAAFVTGVTDLRVAVDATGSTDPDGSIASYTWDFGDGTSATGATAVHDYAAAGSYTISLTVADDHGATSAQTAPVTVTAPRVWARDDFERTVASGWGASDVGGAWAITPNTATAVGKFSVSGGTGKVTLSAGNSYTASLPAATASTDAEERFTVTFSQPSTGGGYYFSAIGRQVDAANDYRAKVRVASTGAVAVWLTRTVAGTETVLTSLTIPNTTVTAGDALSIRFQVSGANATSLKAKVWRTATAEPASWTLTSSDATPALQVPGVVGINSYLSASATAVPVQYSYDGFWAGPAK
ncbi:PKD domain-containing protein [uncultured Microbacterium sp.]|uniref:PKD domain-containing protein n=1 Tax=uncultured Microbacterium sp. TaxID=191216 RepID=UPI0025E9D6D5|nr:PKD domain-containing protein [uncultured Microbacterium sp.]